MTQAAEEPVVHILCMNGGLGCDGDSVALTAATQPSGFTGETTDLLAVCPRCAGTEVDISGGDEMVLESIRYVPTPAGRAG